MIYAVIINGVIISIAINEFANIYQVLMCICLHGGVKVWQTEFLLSAIRFL